MVSLTVMRSCQFIALTVPAIATSANLSPCTVSHGHIFVSPRELQRHDIQFTTALVAPGEGWYVRSNSWCLSIPLGFSVREQVAATGTADAEDGVASAHNFARHGETCEFIEE